MGAAAVTSGSERLLLVGTPFVAMMAVAAGLRVGAPEVMRWAVIYGAAPSKAGTGLAVQVAAFREDDGARSSLAATRLALVGTVERQTVAWSGTTNADGVAEALLPLPGWAGARLQARSGTTLLAQGDARPATPAPPGMSYPTWTPFARREGEIVLDVSVVGQRVSPGFPATICVRATNRTTHAPWGGAEVEAEDDPSWTRTAPSHTARTDSEGWTQLTVRAVGLAVSLSVRARAGDGRTGAWVGGLFVSPGSAGLETRARWSPDEEPRIEVVAPGMRATEYVEIDDARGRAWATTVTPRGDPTTLPSATIIRVPRLAPGLYWAVAAGDPVGASELGPSTTVRPFFVATSDSAALALGTDPTGCAARRDAGETPTALWPCLALAAARPVPHWTALDGLPAVAANARARRLRGVRVATGSIAVATLIEMALLLRMAAAARAQFEIDAGGVTHGSRGTIVRWWSIGIALLVGLLGLFLLAAFVVGAG
jgi:hypothetical protein